MRITTLAVVDEDGVEHRWEGVEGFVKVRSSSYLTEPYVQVVTAQVTLESKGRMTT